MKARLPQCYGMSVCHCPFTPSPSPQQIGFVPSLRHRPRRGAGTPACRVPTHRDAFCPHPQSQALAPIPPTTYTTPRPADYLTSCPSRSTSSSANAHLDNEPLTDQQQGCLTRFQASLSALLSMPMGRKAEIWRDSKLRGNGRPGMPSPRDTRHAIQRSIPAGPP
jgi:hypothetical protein